MTTVSIPAVTVEQFGGLCHLFHTTHCDQIDLTVAQAGDILYYDANNTVCDHARRMARVVMAYLGLRFAEDDQMPASETAAVNALVDEIHGGMRGGEGSLPDVDDDPAFRARAEALAKTGSGPGGVDELLSHPDLVVTEEQAIAEGAIVSMGGWGVADFRGEPVRTVSKALFDALQDAFGLAASAGVSMTEKDWKETLAERKADGQSAPALDDLEGRTGLVPPWAVLGDLLQVLITDAAREGDTGLFTTEPVKALGGRLIWLSKPNVSEWTAYFPEDD